MLRTFRKTAALLLLLLTAGAALAQCEFVCGDTVRDGNGNEYATVRVGALCWTTYNMRAISYADGTPIAKAMIYNSERYNDTVANLANFGRLYTWWSAVNVPEGDDTKPAKDMAGFVQGVCPEGWHIPTVAEMQNLRSVPEKDLHSTDFWVLPNANTNSTGFSEVPGGKFSAELDRFEGLYTNSYMWIDSATSSEWVVACNSRYFCGKAGEESVRKGDGLSVRCVLNYGPLPESCPVVTTDTAFVSSPGNLRLEGHVEDLLGTVESSGFIYGIRKSSLTETVFNESGNHEFIEAEINSLYPCDSIFYVAFLKSSRCTETVYGDTLFIRVPSSISNFPNCGVVYDHEGNKYNTVLIGEQCWTRENMRCKTSPKGTPIPCGNSVYHNFNQPYYFNNTRSQIPDTLKGLLYNWPATLDTSFTAVAHVSFTNRRGICPEGWHVPSDAEWTILENYLQSSDCYVCGENVNAISKALSYNKYWNSNSNDCTPGNDLQSNNSSGFSAMPTGRWERFENNADVFNYINWGSWFWSSTSHLHDNAGDHHYARSRSWWTGDYKIGWYFSGKQVGQAVRCLKNN